jgi:hypothetical protein
VIGGRLAACVLADGTTRCPIPFGGTEWSVGGEVTAEVADVPVVPEAVTRASMQNMANDLLTDRGRPRQVVDASGFTVGENREHSSLGDAPGTYVHER